MSVMADHPLTTDTAAHSDQVALVLSLELSQSKWLVTSLSPGNDKISKHTIQGGDGLALLALLAQLQTKAAKRVSQPVPMIAIHEAGLDGFSVHRLLTANGVESHVVDPASIAVPRRKRRAIAIVAMARKRLVALRRFVTQGVIPEGAVLKAA
jgi:transposase